ncbi:hypothetical protein CHLNCDRAFT_134828 [Chlorella variabilis]|uniref:Uncharacterized protein n=1 Tax=Chlorella variabilis TaxID=554065 RepID=E1ZGW1_CHLVA|nr:hypothetical protein CHLNCDRAFT_134828 [Chlorella variabilis]EFN54821.1 hypothetical protein CHLNCDRAFT_134828 [Chlorella variabilis]|eukprot:XP_005846923.1 hypothetical protein CHLNCDRAFT_134828 [Chlorella variabilis]
MQLADFLGYAECPPDLRQQLWALPPFPPATRHCLLSGPERSGKTSLLFHTALVAARQGKEVLLLCRRQKLEQMPPLLPGGVAISDAAWQRVNIKYLSSGTDLLRYVSLIHALPAGPPDLLLVDDLHALADLPAGDRSRPRDMALCRILASLHEAANVASQLKGSPCQLIVTESSHVEGPRLLYILQRWLPLVLHIRPAGAAHALALLNPQPHIPCTCLAQLRFSVKHSALTLEGMQLGVCW